MEQRPEVSESIIRKIQLLFNLANQKSGHDGASNEVEAAAAMAKAQELLAKYNLDLAIVGATKVPGSPAAEENREKAQSPRTAQYRWQVELMKTLCEANFCWHWVTEIYSDVRHNRHGVQKLAKKQKMKRHVILGRESNRVVVEMMYGYLMDTIENILPYPNTERLSKAAQSWREGCVDRLCERIREKARKMQEVDHHQSTESQTTALAIRSVRDSEYQANYDARWGAGAWAKYKEREARWALEAEERRKNPPAEIVVAETDAQRRKREEKERKQQARWSKQWDREAEREARRLDSSAYYSGQRKGNDIGLDSQLKQGTAKKGLN